MSVGVLYVLFSFTFIDEDLVKLVTSFLLSYPLAGLLKRIPDSKPMYKNLFVVGFVPVFAFWNSSNTLSESLYSIYWVFLICGLGLEL
jgi:hypothetical protein